MKWFKTIVLVVVVNNFVGASETNERFYQDALGYLERGNVKSATKALKLLCRHKMQKACNKLKEITSPASSGKKSEIQHKRNTKMVQNSVPPRKYEGAWFVIRYPGNFRVIPSIKSRTNVKGYDSVFFASPDKSIYFYVFAPQWGGTPKDILRKKSERTIGCKKLKRDGVDYRYCTIRAKDASYYKFYEDVQDHRSNTRHVFGIIYQDRKVYNQYKSLYEQFKRSLVQFSN